MNQITIRTRFAPSPSGLLHLGNARTALFNALYARRMGGVFVLRIEDTDQERSDIDHVNALQQDLLWLGLDWQEGPLTGGPHAPYVQSERGDVYGEYFNLLEQKGYVYNCFCSPRELELSRKTQLASGRPPRYAGTCAELSLTEIRKRLDAGMKPVLRFRVPMGYSLEFDDLVRGQQKILSNDIGDFVIRRHDGTPAFFFSNAIDDALMGISHVLRGEDHLTNTPRQILLMQSLGLPVPQYGHISLIVGADGAPLSKRHGSRSIRELRETHYLPKAINNYLARLGHHYEDNSCMELTGLADQFHLEKLGRAPARYDTTQLLHWQREAIGQADVDNLWQWIGDEVRDLVPVDQRDPFVQAVRSNIMLPEHAQLWARIIYSETLEISHAAREVINDTAEDFFRHALAALEHSQGDFKGLVDHLKKSTGAKGKGLFLPLRVALTGELDGPEIAQLLPLMTVRRAKARLQACLSH